MLAPNARGSLTSVNAFATCEPIPHCGTPIESPALRALIPINGQARPSRTLTAVAAATSGANPR
jgi:hypothetical protein